MTGELIETVLGSGLTGAWYLAKTFRAPKAAAAAGSTGFALSAGGLAGDAEGDEQPTKRERAEAWRVISVRSPH